MIQRLSCLLLLSLLTLSASPAEADEVTNLFDLPASQWRSTCSSTSSPILNRMERHTRFASMQLTVHYTDAPKNLRRSLTEKLCNLFDFSANKIEGNKRRLWGDIPYHYYIAADGQLGEARNPIYQVDSNTAYERDGHIGIVIEGNTKDGISPGQRKKLFSLLGALQRKYRIPMNRIGTHKDYAQTDCPGPVIATVVNDFKRSGAGPAPIQQNCLRMNCAAFKPRCPSWKKLVNKAAPGACCPVWKCEEEFEEEDDDDN